MRLNLRDIDRLVAEEVMRYNLSGLSHLTTPYFSTNIADAWRVVEKYHPEMVVLRRSLQNPDEWVCLIKNSSVVAKTASLAICLAALKEHGIEERE
jgi:hypothetical protein